MAVFCKAAFGIERIFRRKNEPSVRNRMGDRMGSCVGFPTPP